MNKQRCSERTEHKNLLGHQAETDRAGRADPADLVSPLPSTFSLMLEAARAEVPNWRVHRYPAGHGHSEHWAAVSPTFRHDGMTITAPTAAELIIRVRTMVRIIELAAGRVAPLPTGPVGGSLAFGSPCDGSILTPPPAATHAPEIAMNGAPAIAMNGAPVASASGAVSYGDPTQARPQPMPSPIAQGFTGDVCDDCGSMRMARTGKCSTCLECGSTAGCS